MPEKIKIPYYAKTSAREGLEERKVNKAGLNKSEARRLGISSGIERAKQLINNKFLKEDDAKAVARFYLRFRNCKTKRCETVLKLWGGRSFGKSMADTYYAK